MTGKVSPLIVTYFGHQFLESNKYVNCHQNWKFNSLIKSKSTHLLNCGETEYPKGEHSSLIVRISVLRLLWEF